MDEENMVIEKEQLKNHVSRWTEGIMNNALVLKV